VGRYSASDTGRIIMPKMENLDSRVELSFAHQSV
jgi:hypothetical protein